MEEIIKENIKYCKSMQVSIITYLFRLWYWLYQLADPGKIVQIGVSAGACSKPVIGWVKNIVSKQLSDCSVDELDKQTAHAFSLLWMLICRRLSDEVSDNLVTWLTETGIYPMKKEIVQGLWKESIEGSIELDIGGNSFTFKWAELAPTSGVMAANYSRHFLNLFSPLITSLTQLYRYIHHEMNQPHKFAIAWTISQTLADNQGGHFCNSKYGIRVKGGIDTLIVWDPSHFHGTSLWIILQVPMQSLLITRLGWLVLPLTIFLGFGKSMLCSRQNWSSSGKGFSQMMIMMEIAMAIYYYYYYWENNGHCIEVASTCGQSIK